MMNESLEFFNGEFYPSGSAGITLDNRGFRYGDGVFESIRYVSNKILFFDDHYARMYKGAKALELSLPESLNQNYLEDVIHKISGSIDSQNVRIRITLTRKGEGWYTPLANDVEISVSGSPMEFQYRDYQLPAKGLTCGVYNGDQKAIGKLSNIKTQNGLLYVMAGLSAKNAGWDDALIQNNKGAIIESSNSNLFIRSQEKYLTPPLSDGCLEGVMRAKLISILRSKGFPVFETSLSTFEILNADEVLLTNVISGIRWVEKFQNREYQQGQAAHLVDLLNESLQ